MDEAGQGATKGIRKMQEKHARAQHKLRRAQDDLAAARIEGQQEIQRARLDAEKNLAKHRREVERRVEKVARLEQALIEAGAPPIDLDAMTPEDTVAVVEQIEVEE